MTRVSDASSMNALINNMLRNQERVDNANFQVVTGKKANDYAGIGFDTQRLVNLENQRDMSGQFNSNNDIAQLNLDVMAISLESIHTVMTDFQNRMSDFIMHDSYDQENIEQLQDFAFNSMKNLEAFLNADAAGKYVFSGSKVNTEPVSLELTSFENFQSKYDGTINKYPTTRDSHLATISKSTDENTENTAFVSKDNWLTFNRDSDNDDTTNGVSSITATSDMFSDYKVGSRITISDTDSNDGEYTIQSVSSDGTQINVKTEMLTDGTFPAGLGDTSGTFANGLGDEATETTVTFTLPDTSVLANGTTGDISFSQSTGTVTAVNVAAFAGVSVGDVIDIGGSTSSNGSFEVTAIDASSQTLTVASTAETGVTFTLPDASTLAYAGTGGIDFDRAAGTISAVNSAAFSNVSVGDVISVGGSNNSDGSFTVTAIDATSQTLTVTNTNIDITTSDGTVINSADMGRMVFDRENDTITVDSSTALDGLSVGERFTISGTAGNDGTYTVGALSGDGKTLTINSSKLTDAGQTTGDKFFDYKVGTQFSFNTGTDTIQAQDASGAIIPGLFDDFKAGDSITITNSTTNNGTYTIETISSDGATVTLDASTQLVGSTEVDNNGAEITSAARGISASIGNQINFISSTNTILLEDITSGVDSANVFDDLRPGMQITISGSVSNDGNYTIASIAGDGTAFTVEENLASDETFNPSVAGTAVSLKVFGASGTVATSSSYYNGNEQALTHRIDEHREMDMDVTAAHPSFEKALRAMALIAQGKYGSEGGLEENRERLVQSQFLIDDAMNSPSEGNAPFGDELSSDFNEIVFQLGSKQTVLSDTKAKHTQFMNLLDGFISDAENVDQLEAITSLMNQQRALEASYQAMSKMFSMNLADFL